MEIWNCEDFISEWRTKETARWRCRLQVKEDNLIFLLLCWIFAFVSFLILILSHFRKLELIWEIFWGFRNFWIRWFLWFLPLFWFHFISAKFHFRCLFDVNSVVIRLQLFLISSESTTPRVISSACFPYRKRKQCAKVYSSWVWGWFDDEKIQIPASFPFADANDKRTVAKLRKAHRIGENLETVDDSENLSYFTKS